MEPPEHIFYTLSICCSHCCFELGFSHGFSVLIEGLKLGNVIAVLNLNVLFYNLGGFAYEVQFSSFNRKFKSQLEGKAITWKLTLFYTQPTMKIQPGRGKTTYMWSTPNHSWLHMSSLNFNSIVPRPSFNVQKSPCKRLDRLVKFIS